MKEKNIDFDFVYKFCDHASTVLGCYPGFAEFLMKDNNFDVLAIVWDNLEDAVYFYNYNEKITVYNCKKY